jgi:hypothetical protein
MITHYDPPPGFPPDDDGTEDGGGPPRCTNCAAAHHTWQCPEIGKRLFVEADNAIIFEKIKGTRERIAQLRRQNCHITASIMRDEMLSQIETWIDPDTARLRAHAFPPKELSYVS